MAADAFVSQALFAVDVIIDGRDFGRFMTSSAPRLVAEAFKVRPPGGAERAVPNPIRSREDMELSRKATLADIDAGDWLDARVGVGSSTLVFRALDHSLNPWGRPRSFGGVFIDHEGPETNSDEGAEAATFTLRFALNELAG